MRVFTEPRHISGALSAPMMAREVDQLRERIERRLRHAGVRLSDIELHDVAEAVLADAVRLSLDWLDIERAAAN